MTARAILAALAMVLMAQPVSAQISATKTPAGCIKADSRVVATGTLTEATFTDPWGKERAFILQLPIVVCLDDGGEFADPAEHFTRVHLSAVNNGLIRVLAAAVGRKITVHGEGFSAHTRHHRAPLVILADKVEVE